MLTGKGTYAPPTPPEINDFNWSVIFKQYNTMKITDKCKHVKLFLHVQLTKQQRLIRSCSSLIIQQQKTKRCVTLQYYGHSYLRP